MLWQPEFDAFIADGLPHGPLIHDPEVLGVWVR
jgi:hypothetical protein